MKLRVRSVTVSGNLKSFGLMDGVSAGSEMSVTADVPEGLTPVELSQEISHLKRWLDLKLVMMEKERGVFPRGILEHMQARVMAALKPEEPAKADGPGGTTDPSTGG